MSTTQSKPSDFEHQLKRATKNHPFSQSDEFLDSRLGHDAVNANGENSTYLGVQDNQLTDHASQERINLYARLELYNRGTHNLKWTTDQSAKHDNDDFLFCEALTSQMGLSSSEQKTVWRLFKGMDMRSFKKFDARTKPGRETAEQYKQYLVVFCIGALLYNENLPERCSDWTYYPTKVNYPCKCERYRDIEPRYRAQKMGDAGDGHRVLERIAEVIGLTEEDIRSCYEKLRVRLRGYFEEDEEREED